MSGCWPRGSPEGPRCSPGVDRTSCCGSVASTRISGKVDELSIIDITFNPNGHGRLATGRRVPPEKLDIDEDDSQVPLTILNCERPDLVAAGELLATTWNRLSQWGFGRFPGALFEIRTGRLVLPVPTWDSPVSHAERAISLLIRLWKNGPLGNIQEIALLGLDGRQGPTGTALEYWQQILGHALPFTHFASPDDIQLINLTQL